MDFTNAGDHVTCSEAAAQRIAAIAAPFRPRWYQQHTSMFEVNYWDDPDTWSAISAAARVAAVSGNAWLFTTEPPECRFGWHLNPVKSFTQALFSTVEHLTGVDAGTLSVDISPDRVTVRGTPHTNNKGANRARNKALARGCVLYREELTYRDVPLSVSALNAARMVHIYPQPGATTARVSAYSSAVVLFAGRLTALGWDELWDAPIRGCGIAADDELVKDAVYKVRADDTRGVFLHEAADSLPVIQAETLMYYVSRLAEVRSVAATHGLTEEALDEIVDDAVPTDEIAALAATAFR